MRLSVRILLVFAFAGLLATPPRPASGQATTAEPRSSVHSATASTLTDPGPAWRGITDTTALRLRVERHLEDADSLLQRVRTAKQPPTVDNTFVPLNRATFALLEAQRLARMGLMAHPDSSFRAAAQALKARPDERLAALEVDPTLYEAVAQIDTSALDPDLRYVVERTLAAYRRNGADLDEATRTRVTRLRARLAELATQFERNIDTDVRTVHLHPDSMAGVPGDWVETHLAGPRGEDGKVAVPITWANGVPLVTYADSRGVREAAARALWGQGYPENVPLIDSLRALRHELARLLGYPSWAAYALEPMMAQTPARVERFLNEVDSASATAAEREIEALLAVQRQDDPTASSISGIDVLYLETKLREQKYAFDEDAMREYLPYRSVRDGVLDIFEEMFGLEFRPAPSLPVWSAAVEPYEVWDGGRLIGRIYLDMHPREGKFGYFASFRLRFGGGTLPEVVLLCNFPRGSQEGGPGLLTPGHLALFFHEFGHGIHDIYAGQRAIMEDDFQRDFMEAPSILLEEWARDPAVLRRVAKHHETGAPIPTELVEAYRRSDAVGRALHARHYLWWADVSFSLHTAPPEGHSTTEIERDAAERLPYKLPDWVHLSTNLPHLSDYTSNVYTYAWSTVIARDLLTGFDRSNLLDPEVARRYRDLVLRPTGTAPSGALVGRFLGRPFTAEAWGAWLQEGG